MYRFYAASVAIKSTTEISRCLVLVPVSLGLLVPLLVVGQALFCFLVFRHFKSQRRSTSLGLPDEVVGGLLLQSNVTLVVSDHQGRIEWVNPHFKNQTGFDPEEVLGKKPGDFLQGPLTLASDIADFRKGLSSGQSFTAEILNYSKEGRPYTIEALVAPVRNEVGEVKHFISVQRDITEMKRKNEELRSALESITTSLNLARRIQDAFFLSPGRLHEKVQRGFLLSMSRGILSADFVLFRTVANARFLFVGSGGFQGPPAAVLNMLITHVIDECLHTAPESDPGQLLQKIYAMVFEVLNRGGKAMPETAFDLACLKMQETPGQGTIVQVAGNRVRLATIHEGELEEIRTDTQAQSLAGLSRLQYPVSEWNTQGDRLIYLWTDGLNDQIGGILGKKYTRKNFLTFLGVLSNIPIEIQEESLRTEIETWKGQHHQVSDITVAGLLV